MIKIESTQRREIKGQTPQLTLLYCGRTVRSSHRRCSIKKAALKNFAKSTGNTCVEVSFKKKRPQHSCFLVNIKKSLRLPILKNICEWLLGPKGSRSRLYDGVRLQGLSHRSSFLFLSRHLSSQPAFENLRRIPLMSQLSFYIGYF